ncbi:hypothetical protein GUITHDRAFT_137950 [Guillardia theta CCMP2712]|uniref:Mitochondrial carrier protein n=1 Tax=Guillardia theta (strain CCMP2712) TaxID=905079 RepID=L1JF96_GUITC|nr:hypothetical protein GUITHDRAFT_137950 [Guillardia theta CCMP2712]EKX46987.1 hypothetical protein GUITHDRAFT_137950 [Guillardia theta CCMP2712]|eukprot:XP_005833967.1 hypothetical protein GUITHDRAFT_137950 [Guillardia theta CCMP2712]
MCTPQHRPLSTQLGTTKDVRCDRRSLVYLCLIAASGLTADVIAPSAVLASAGSEAKAEANSGFLSGVAVSVAKQTVLYPIDTIKVRLQTTPLEPSTPLWKRGDLFKGLYKGYLIPLIFNAPASGVFFGMKDAVKSYFSWLGNAPSTLLAIFIAQFPYWVVRQPSEILKVRDQLVRSTDGSSIQDQGLLNKLKQLDPRSPENLKALFQGFGSNLAYTFPADALKFSVYDVVKAQIGPKGKDPLIAAVTGALSTIVAQVATTPLDVARNKIMGSNSDFAKENTLSAMRVLEKRIIREEGSGALMLGVTPRILRAILSGAIQFTTYEFTKGAVKK